MEIKTILILSGKVEPDFEECCSLNSSFPGLAEDTTVTNQGCGVPSINKKTRKNPTKPNHPTP